MTTETELKEIKEKNKAAQNGTTRKRRILTRPFDYPIADAIYFEFRGKN